MEIIDCAIKIFTSFDCIKKTGENMLALKKSLENLSEIGQI